MQQNAEALTANTKDGRQLFTGEHLKTLQQIADDLAFLGGSQKSVNKLANRASLGQPTTAQALIMSTKGWLRAIPGSAIASKALEVVKGWQNDAVYKVLTRAMLEDKNYAKILASKATEKTIAKAIEPFLYAGVDVARREAPRIGQAVAQTSTTQTKPRRTQSRPLQQSQGARSEIQSHTERSSSLNDAPPPATTQGVKRTSVDVAKLPPFIRAVLS